MHDILFESLYRHDNQMVHLFVVTDKHEGELGCVVDVTFLFGHAEDSVFLGHKEEGCVLVIEHIRGTDIPGAFSIQQVLYHGT